MSNKSKVCSNFIWVASNVMALFFAIFQALFMESPWRWATIAATIFSVLLSNTFALNKISAMLFAKVQYNPYKFIDILERQFCCCVAVIGAVFSIVSLFYYTFCSSRILNCPDGVIAGSITCAIVLIPALYLFVRCMYHEDYTKYKAKKILDYNRRS